MCALDADFKAAELKFECNKKYLGIGKALELAACLSIVTEDLSEKKDEICIVEDSCLRSYYMKAFHAKKRCEESSDDEQDCDKK